MVLKSELETQLEKSEKQLETTKEELGTANQTIINKINEDTDNTIERLAGIIGGGVIGGITAIFSGIVPLWGYVISEAIGTVAGPACYGLLTSQESTKPRISKRSMGWSLATTTLLNLATLAGHNSGTINSVEPFQTQYDSGVIINQGGYSIPRHATYTLTPEGEYILFSDLEAKTLDSLKTDQTTTLDSLEVNQGTKREEVKKDFSARREAIYKYVNPPKKEENNQ